MKRRNRLSATGFASEADMAKVVVDSLRRDGWTVYQEVEAAQGIADIVATRGEQVAVVEAKLTLGLTVLGQAHRWKGRAHLVWVAVPAYLARASRGIGGVICAALGLGLLEVSAPWDEGDLGRIRVATEPKQDTGAGVSKLLAVLRPEHQTYAEAGSPTGHRWSKFRESERNLLGYVSAYPGELAKEVMGKIQHHWRGKHPHASVLKLVRRGIIKGIRIEEHRAGVRLYPVEASAAPGRLDEGALEVLAARALQPEVDVLGTILTVASGAMAAGVTSTALTARIQAQALAAPGDLGGTPKPPAPPDRRAPRPQAGQHARQRPRQRTRAWRR